VNIVGVCNIKCSDTLHLKKLVFDFPGVGSANLLLNADSIKITNEGTGGLNLQEKLTIPAYLKMVQVQLMLRS
jgi:hypothetical protein